MTHPLEEETAREIAVTVIPDTVIYVVDLRLKAEPVILAALRLRADEATRAERDRCTAIARSHAPPGSDRSLYAAEEIAREINDV